MVPLGLGAAWLLYKDRDLWDKLRRSTLVRIILVYIVLQIVLGLFAVNAQKVNTNALLYGWIIGSRFLVFFLIMLVLAAKTNLHKNWRKIILLPATVVIGFGLLQQFILPADFLRHFGYSSQTLVPFQTIDLKPDYVRLQSTLRGPNPLGAYLILVIISAAAYFFTKKNQRIKKGIYVFAAGLVLFFTYSRSAWIGTFLSLGLLLWLTIKNAKTRKVLAMAGAGLILLSSAVLVVFRNNDRIQNTFFHVDEHSTSVRSSNDDRTSALEDGLKDLWNEPLGRGPGTAGPASARNTYPARIAENYYLQIGQETGLAGFLLFIAINIYATYYLWRNRQDQLSLILLTSLIGITFVNLLSHAWADDVLSLIWWGLAGIALSSVILKQKAKAL